MKRIFILALGMFMAITAVFSQAVQTWTEDFDGTTSFFANPTGSWVFNPDLHLPGSSVSNPLSYWGIVPNALGSSIILQTLPYDFTDKVYVTLTFHHICKISPQDTVLIQYLESGTSTWKNLPSYAYMGDAIDFDKGFSAASYPEWEVDDSTAIPQQSWWKRETFDLSIDFQHGIFTFRFVIKRGQTQGTQTSYGWLLENFEILASAHQLYVPTVEFTDPLTEGVIYNTGPWEINAKVKTNTNAPINPPWLVFSATGNNTFADSIPMTMVEGDSLWQATIPKFEVNTTVSYAITATDTFGNQTMASKSFVITRPQTIVPGDCLIVGTGINAVNRAPISRYDQYAWSRQLYLSEEINEGKGGLITKIAWYLGTSGGTNLTCPNQTCYFQIVDDISITNNAYINPATAGATQVLYNHQVDLYSLGWIEIPLDESFFLPRGKNLLIYWENRANNYTMQQYFFHHPTSANMTVYAGATNTFPSGNAGTFLSSRANAQFCLSEMPNGEYSVELYSIDVSNTVEVSSGVGIPLVVTIKNKSAHNLTTIRLSYSLNNAAPVHKDITLTTPLPWDYTAQQTIDNYFPKINGYDTLKVWTSLPNGQNDPDKYDDTLIKIIYGSSDLNLSFVDFPANTVNNTGPFAISARIESLSESPIGQVTLNVDTSCTGTHNNFTLPMTIDLNTGLYKADIPHTLFGSDVTYSITLTDERGNTQSIEKSFYINPPTTGGNSNAVALVAIHTPEAGGVVFPNSIPIVVTIRNKGADNLTSCNIVYKLNGNIISTYPYSGDLAEDFTQTITIGNYTPTELGKNDTIVVKVSDPNTFANPNGNIDSIRIITLGCTGNLSGVKTVNSTTGDFASIAQALTVIRECNLTGDLTLLLKGVYTESVNLSNLTPYLRGHRLTITSADDHVDSAIIQPVSGTGITLGNTNNITLKKITVNTSHLTTNTVQFTAACSNIVIRDCKLLANPTTTSSISPIYKGGSTGIADNISIINNLLDGGYYGCSFIGGTGTTQYGTRTIIDSNTVTNGYSYGLQAYYTDFLHISHNKIRSRDANSTANWSGLYLSYVNGDIIGNQIIQRNPLVPSNGVINLQYYNYNLTNKRAFIANNELIYQSGIAAGTGLLMSYVNADFVHNSFYMSSAGDINGFSISNVNGNWVSIKNNNIVLFSSTGYLFRYAGATHTNQYDMDYNNFYTNRSAIGALVSPSNYTVPLSSLADLKQHFTTARNMLSLSPAYVDISENSDLMVINTNLHAPALPAVTQDIEGKSRPAETTMGAYQIVAYSDNVGLNRILSWEKELPKDFIFPMDVEIQNLGTGNIQNAVLVWSLNGEIQDTVTWTPTPSASFMFKDTLNMGSFTVSEDVSSYSVEVWIQSVNNIEDMYHRNDTLRADAENKPLIEWKPPFVQDTIYKYIFDVNAVIRTLTGAPMSPPELTLISTIEDRYVHYDTLAMDLVNGAWTVSVPQQYYGSKVIYSLTVSDSLGNTVMITDSVYIQFSDFAEEEDVIIGTSTSSYTNYVPIYTSPPYSWTRQIYLYNEVSPDTSPKGVWMTKIAWQLYNSNPATYINQTCYMRPTTNAVQPSGAYIDPLSNGAKEVWKGNLNIATGWQEITLNEPFFLPYNMNLEIFWINEQGSNNSSCNFYYTSTQSVHRSVFAGTGGSPANLPTTGGSTSNYRANIKITTLNPSLPYGGINLALTAMLTPINDFNALCVQDYSTVEAVIVNDGEDDYDFAQDPVTVYIEVINPLGIKDSLSFVLDTGILASGKSDILKIMSALPIMYTGAYNIKVWIESPVDYIIYDDTLLYEFVPSRITVPIDIDFSATTLPIQLDVIAVVGNSQWYPYTPTVNDSVQPYPGNGTGVLRFDGIAGTMTLLSTRQLDLLGSDQPQLEFWYYHDTTHPVSDASYLDVNAVVGGVSTNLLHLLHRQDFGQGWEHYIIPLDSFTTTSECLLIQFEAMNKVTGVIQYIDRIRITARQDIAITGVLVDYPACELQNREWKVILSNLTSPVVDYENTPTDIVLEVGGMFFTKSLQTGLVNGFSSDTITLSPTFNFAPGTYSVKAYFTSKLDYSPSNDTLITSVNVNPELKVSTEKLSNGNMFAEIPAYQTVTLHNIGNLELANLGIILQIDTGAPGSPTYFRLEESYMGSIVPGDSVVYSFTNPYIVPWSKDYQVRIIAYLLCDSAMANATTAIIEDVDMKDLYIVSIDNLSTVKDTIGNTIPVAATLINRSDYEDFRNVEIAVSVTNSQSVQTETFTETVDIIDHLFSAKRYSFVNTYTVPNDSVYYLTVYTNSYDLYSYNDTMIMRREAVEKQTTPAVKGIEGMDGFTLDQNIPNPAGNSTRIDYSIPESGEVIFHVQSVSGQLLYSKTIEATSGVNSLEFNTSTLAAGIYIYSIEYKGQRLIKRMSIQK
jgi:hypothetical protein